MIYTNLTKKAMLIAYHVHEGQLDKAGIPYIYHPFYVAENMRDEITTSAALLHDVCEDTDITIEKLRAEGIPEIVLEALEKLTHNKEESYQNYIEKVASNEIAAEVKIMDLIHNSDLTRLSVITEKDKKRTEKYKKALKYLKEKRNCKNS